MKKNAVLILIFLVVAGLGFAGGKTDSLQGEKIRVVFWHRTSDNFEKEIAAFEALNPDVTIVSEAIGTNYDDLYTKYMTAIASNSLPNIGIVGQRHGISQMYESGKLLPIEDFLDPASIKDVMPGYWGRFIYDGKKVCVPYSSSVPVLYYNADLFERNKLSPPKRFSEIPAIAKQLTLDTNGDGKPDVYGFNFNADTPWYLQAWVWDCGFRVTLAGDKASVDNGGYRQVFETISNMVHIDKSMPANQHSTSIDDFMNGYTAMFITSSANLKQLSEGCTFKLGVAPFPGKNTILGGNSLGVFAADKKTVEAGVRFINYLLSLDGSLTNIKKGYLPIRNSFLQSAEIKDLLKKEPERRVSIDSVAHLSMQGVNVADSTIWMETKEIVSEVEANSKADIPALLAEFQKTVNRFYADYYR